MIEKDIKREQYFAMASAALAVSFWGASFTATKVAVNEVSPLILLWLRFGIGSLVLALVLVSRGSFRLPGKGDLFSLAKLGFLGIFLHNFIQAQGLKTASAGISSLTLASTPVVIAIMGNLFLSERLSRRQISGIIIAALGVLLVVTGGNLGVLTDIGASSGELLIIISVITWAAFAVVSRKALQTFMPSLAMFYVMFCGWIFITVCLLISGDICTIFNLTTRGWASIFFLGVFASAFSYLLWYEALRILPASRTGVFMYLNPIVGVLVASIVLSEPIGATVIAGGSMVLAGMTLVNIKQSR